MYNYKYTISILSKLVVLSGFFRKHLISRYIKDREVVMKVQLDHNARHKNF